MVENLLMDVVRMLQEREDYFEKEWQNSTRKGLEHSAAIMLGKATAYNSARQMLMAALTENTEILKEYDVYHKEEN